MTTMALPPRIAVLLPVYNGEKYIAEAIHSVLAQTFADFELIVIDDGSTDGSAEVLEGFSDARLRVIRFSENRGLVMALNRGIRESRSELIARMDADDICMPRRFERQVAFLDCHPEVAICGTWTRQFGEESGVWRPPLEPKQIHARLFFSHAMDHPSIMLRRAFLEQYNLAYDEEFRHVEDIDFFQRAAEFGNLANLPEALLRVRAHAEETSVIHEREGVQSLAQLMVRQLRMLMPGVTTNEEDFHMRILDGDVDTLGLPRAEQWLSRLEMANRERARYDVGSFRRELRLQSYRLHTYTAGADFLAVLASYKNSPLGDRRPIHIPACGSLIIKLAFFRLLRMARVCKKWLLRRRNEKLPING